MTVDLFKTIRRIQILSTQLANDVLAGAYKSAFKGRGMEFEEVREYQTGDEVRSIDWNVTARMDKPYVKNFREERDITVLLMVDMSASLRFGSKEHMKATLVAEIGAVLAFSAIKNNDKIGLILFSDAVEKYIPPRKGTRHVLRIIRELLSFESKRPGSDLRSALAFLGKIQNRRGICFVISDFFCPNFSHEAALIAKKHDLISISVTDPSEHAFPDIGIVQLSDLETNGTMLIDTSSDQVHTEQRLRAEQHLAKQKGLMQKIGAGFIDIRTDQPYMKPLRRFFKLREIRRK